VEIYIGTDLVMTGTLERIDASLTEGGRVLTLQGRSLPGVLVDCGIDGALEYSGLALSTIARQICNPFGVSVRADNDTNPLDLALAEYGQSAADFLNSLAAPRLLLLNSSYSGQLVISWGRGLKDVPIVADLVENKGSVLSVSASFDDTRLFSVYKAATQFAGEADIVGQSRDSAIKVYRPLLLSVGETDQDPDITARRLRSEANAAALSVSVTLAGWRRPDGLRWAERQAITLTAPSAMLRTKAKYIVASCTLSLSESGQTTALRLAQPETYTGETPRETPWA
jgi:prophage tail gpP-like protein